MGLWRESEAFLRPLNGGVVFENSTACVYVETSRPGFGLVVRLRYKPSTLFGGETL